MITEPRESGWRTMEYTDDRRQTVGKGSSRRCSSERVVSIYGDGDT